MSKRIAIALAVAAIIGIAAAAIVFGKGGEDGPGAEDPVTRGEWVEMLGSGFGIDEHSGEQPYFDDVVESSELFAYAQSCAEWGVLEPGGSLLPDEPATRLFVARTALAAAEVDWSGYGQGSDGGGALECAFELGVVARGQADDPMTQMACDQALDVALSLFCAPSEGYADITLKASVADLSEVEGIAAGEGFVEGSSSALGGVEQGDVIVVMQDGGPTAHKVEHVGEAGGSVRLGTSTPEIGETFETFDFSVTAYVGRDDIEPLTDGVSVSEVRTAQAGFIFRHRCVKVHILPDRAADCTLRKQTKANALCMHAAKQHKGAGIRSILTNLADRQQTCRLFTGEHIAFRRAHAEHVLARTNTFKGKDAIFIGDRARQNAAA